MCWREESSQEAEESKEEAEQGWAGGERKARLDYNSDLQWEAAGSWGNGRTNHRDIREQSKKAAGSGGSLTPQG